MLVISAGIQVDMRMFQRPEDRMTAVAAAERQRSKAIALHKRQSAATSRYAASRGTERVCFQFLLSVLPSFSVFAFCFIYFLVFVFVMIAFAFVFVRLRSFSSFGTYFHFFPAFFPIFA